MTDITHEDKMSNLEKKAFSKCVNNAILAMDELRGEMIRAQNAEDPLVYDDKILVKHNALGDAMNAVMVGLGYDDDDEEYEGPGSMFDAEDDYEDGYEED